MLRPRWKKVLRDLTVNPTRTALVVLSIAVGVFAFGTIMTTRILLNENLRSSYLATNPSSATLTTEPFDDELVAVARRVPGVAHAEGGRVVAARIQTGSGAWLDAVLYVLPEGGERSIDVVAPWEGAWPPADKTVLLERSSLTKTGAALGEQLAVALPGHEARPMPVVGLVHDLSLAPGTLASQVVGYITFDTLAWLGGPITFNQLEIVVAERRDDQAHIQAVVEQVEQAIDRSGREVLSRAIPTPLQHPAEAVLPAVLTLLTSLSVLALLVSTFLIVNTISAILTQQTRQIGVMKSIGARSSQLAGLYFTMAAAFGVLALLFAVPLGAGAAFALTRFLGGLLNVDITIVRLPLEVVAMQAVTAVLVPLAASVFPVRAVVARPAREALAGSADAPTGRSLVDRLIGSLPGLGRPTRLALRNTFRRKGRLVRTLAALALGGAVFIAVMSLRAALYATLDASMTTQRHDIEVQLSQPYRLERAVAAAARVPGVSAVEGLRRVTAFPVHADGRTAEALVVRAIPADSALFAPDLVEGRWLHPGDSQAIVLTSNYRTKDPGAQVGDLLTLELAGGEERWRIVGFVDELLPPTSPASAYLPLAAYTEVVGGAGRVDTLRVVTAGHDGAAHAAAVAALERQLRAEGLEAQLIRSRTEDRAILDQQFQILTAVLTLMALLIGVVGGLGLSGTMSINVIERTREIGVLRAIGASDGAVRQIVLSEGVTIAVIAWLVGSAVSVPLSYLMCVALGMTLLNAPLDWVYSLSGLALWLVIVLVIAVVASLLPARSAVRLTVREVLAYE